MQQTGSRESAQGVTELLLAWQGGNAEVQDRLVPLVQGELRKIAGCLMRRERPDHTLQPTALVHEAYLRLVNQDHRNGWRNRTHFYAAAAYAMRRILVEHARAQRAAKRWGSLRKLPLNEALDTPTLLRTRFDGMNWPGASRGWQGSWN